VLGTIAILFAYIGITATSSGGGDVLHLNLSDTVTPELGTYIIAVFVILTRRWRMSSVAYMDVSIRLAVTVIWRDCRAYLFLQAGDGRG